MTWMTIYSGPLLDGRGYDGGTRTTAQFYQDKVSVWNEPSANCICTQVAFLLLTSVAEISKDDTRQREPMKINPTFHSAVISVPGVSHSRLHDTDVSLSLSSPLFPLLQHLLDIDVVSGLLQVRPSPLREKANSNNSYLYFTPSPETPFIHPPLWKSFPTPSSSLLSSPVFNGLPSLLCTYSSFKTPYLASDLFNEIL